MTTVFTSVLRYKLRFSSCSLSLLTQSGNWIVTAARFFISMNSLTTPLILSKADTLQCNYCFMRLRLLPGGLLAFFFPLALSLLHRPRASPAYEFSRSSVKKDSFDTYILSLGYQTQLTLNPEETVIVHGSNAIEHVVNLIDESGMVGRRILVVSGWNVGRVDPLMWELEPRVYEISVEVVSEQPSPNDIGRLVNAIMLNSIDAVVGMGSGSVMDACKVAVTILRDRKYPENSSVRWLKQFQDTFGSDEIDYISGQQRPLLVTVPNTPLLGSEVNRFSSVLPPHRPHDSEAIHCKDYIRTVHPDICAVQPNIFYRLPMTLLHDRIVGTFSLAIQLLILHDDFYTTYIALDTVKKVVPIFINSIKVRNYGCEIRKLTFFLCRVLNSDIMTG